MHRMRAGVLIEVIALISFHLGIQSAFASRQTQTNAQRPVSNVIACKALEAHTSAQPGVTVVLFHQRDKKDQPRFASLLKQADGSTIEIRIGRGAWQSVSVARLRMCFGRGLLVFPSGQIKLRDKDEFQARFSTNKAPAAQ